jgi:protein O-mannosyl-transferase
MIQHRLIDGSLDSHSMKTVNLGIHIINCCLLLHFLKSILVDRKARFLTILMFSVHPIHVEAVCGIVSRSDLLGCLTFLLSGIIYFNVFHKGKVGYYQKAAELVDCSSYLSRL